MKRFAVLAALLLLLIACERDNIPAPEEEAEQYTETPNWGDFS